MKRLLIILLLILSNVCRSYADAPKEHRLLIVLDASDNMLGSWAENVNRYQAASEFITRLADSIHAANPDVSIAIRAYGHTFPANYDNCKDSRTEVIFGKNNRIQIDLRLRDIKPKGKPALTFAIREIAKQDMNFAPQSSHCFSIIFVTASENTCDDDYCAYTKSLLNTDIVSNKFVISLKDNERTRAQYDCLGRYLPVTNIEEMSAVIDTIKSYYETGFVTKAEPEEKIQKPIAEQENDPTINSYNTFKPSTDAGQKSYLFFTSKLNAESIELFLQDGREFKPYKEVEITLPMANKIIVTSGRYRVTYTTKGENGVEKKIKEFYVRLNKDNNVDLD